MKTSFVKRDTGVYLIDLSREICNSGLKMDCTAHGIMESLSEFGLQYELRDDLRVKQKMITPFHVIIFHIQLLLSFLCYHFPMYIFCVIIYVIIFRVLSFMISFDVIIVHGQQMLSFLCYNFPLYIFCVIISVIIYCYHDIYIMKNEHPLQSKK